MGKRNRETISTGTGVVGRSRPVYFGNLRIWAEDGLIWSEVVEERPLDSGGNPTEGKPRVTHMTPDQAAERMKLVFASAEGLAETKQDVAEVARTGNEVMDLIQIAREQAAELEFKAKHERNTSYVKGSGRVTKSGLWVPN